MEGESAHIEPVPVDGVVANHHHWHAIIHRETGVAPPTITCALIDNKGVVQQIVCADPAIDKAPSGFTMVRCYSPKIIVGCAYSAATGLFTLPKATIPAHTAGNQTASPIQVPATVSK